jgi:hypothetical protein
VYFFIGVKLVFDMKGETKPRVFANRALRRIFGSMTDEEVRGRKLLIEEFDNLYPSPS